MVIAHVYCYEKIREIIKHEILTDNEILSDVTTSEPHDKVTYQVKHKNGGQGHASLKFPWRYCQCCGNDLNADPNEENLIKLMFEFKNRNNKEDKKEETQISNFGNIFSTIKENIKKDKKPIDYKTFHRNLSSFLYGLFNGNDNRLFLMKVTSMAVNNGYSILLKYNNYNGSDFAKFSVFMNMMGEVISVKFWFKDNKPAMCVTIPNNLNKREHKRILKSVVAGVDGSDDTVNAVTLFNNYHLKKGMKNYKWIFMVDDIDESKKNTMSLKNKVEKSNLELSDDFAKLKSKLDSITTENEPKGKMWVGVKNVHPFETMGEVQTIGKGVTLTHNYNKKEIKQFLVEPHVEPITKKEGEQPKVVGDITTHTEETRICRVKDEQSLEDSHYTMFVNKKKVTTIDNPYGNSKGSPKSELLAKVLEKNHNPIFITLDRGVENFIMKNSKESLNLLNDDIQCSYSCENIKGIKKDFIKGEMCTMYNLMTNKECKLDSNEKIGTLKSENLIRVIESGFKPIYVTYYGGEETFIFKTKKEANKAFNKLECKPYADEKILGWWYGSKKFYDLVLKNKKEIKKLTHLYRINYE